MRRPPRTRLAPPRARTGPPRRRLRVSKGRLKKRDKILEAVGRFKERFPKAHPFVTIHVGATHQEFTYAWNVAKFKDALRRDGAYLLRSYQAGWSAKEFWETYIQLTVVERAFRVLKTNLLLRPIWHQYSGRTKAHVFICVLATLIHKPDPRRGNAAGRRQVQVAHLNAREFTQDHLRRHRARFRGTAANWCCAAWLGPIPLRNAP